eukprot:TRINITY_DN12221_c0_g1_i3.p1 TRINITY_DN12221_c0_g1~~TRINITY_DN12221_c0_g1_i3.p1  ORF type:complete len:205 (+),score=41.08 TRINITY_DN12221_c0_g1_i3:39-617(+)
MANQVDLSTNSAELKEAYDLVCSGSDEADWLIADYKGKTNTLKISETGDGGLEEIVEEFNGSRIQYGFVRVEDPNTKVTKFVLINWSGEGAPVIRKGQCAGHVSDVANYFHGAHVTVNARSEADLDADAIIKKVEKSSGANYSSREKARPEFANTGAGRYYVNHAQTGIEQCAPEDTFRAPIVCKSDIVLAQ